MEIDRLFQMVAPHRQNRERFRRRFEVGTPMGYYFDVGRMAVLSPPSHSAGSCPAELNIVIPHESGSEHLWQTFDSDSVLAPNLGVGATSRTNEYCFWVG